MENRTSAKPNKQQIIVTTLRERIGSGSLPPGSCLSSRTLRQEFQACATTTQAAIKQLVADGFLYTESTRGTYVSLTPPHLTTYAVVFPDNPLASPPNGTRQSMLAYQCLSRRQAGRQKINLYFNVTGHVDDEDYQRVLADITAHRLAGIFIIDSRHLLDTPLFTHPGIARVTLNIVTPAVPAIVRPREQFFTKGLDYLAARGRRQVAILGCALPSGKEFCLEQTAARDLDMKPYGFISVLPVNGWEQYTIVRHYLYLLMRNPLDRPDCILLADDVILDSVVAGIFDAGLRVGEDVDVVAHCNYPLLKPDQWPVKRLGCPVPIALDTVFALIDHQRRGEAAPATVTIPYLFDEEYAALPSGDGGWPCSDNCAAQWEIDHASAC